MTLLPPGLSRPEKPRADSNLDRLATALAEELTADARPERGVGAAVAALLRAFVVDADGWRRYAHFSDDTYSRNLVWRDDQFELLLLCWGEGHESPIHDHASQHCWMAVLEGELEEVHFATDGEAGGLRRGRTRSFAAGSVGYIHDDIALHMIRPCSGTRSVSLHFYSAPVDACRVFCPDTGRGTTVEVGYDSVRGTPCEGVDPDAIRAAW